MGGSFTETSEGVFRRVRMTTCRLAFDEALGEMPVGLNQEAGPSKVAASLSGCQYFNATLIRGGLDEPWGLALDLSGGRAIHLAAIKSHANTPAKRYNMHASEDRRLEQGDYVIGANSVFCHGMPANAPEAKFNSQVEAVAQELKTSTIVILHIVRPHLFSCEVSRGNETMGLDLCHSNNFSYVVITAVHEGAVRKTAPQICPGDRIMAVDQKRAENPCQLLQMIKERASPVLLISRPGCGWQAAT